MKQKMNPAIIVWAILGFCAFILILVWTVATSDLEIDPRAVISKEEASEAAVLFIQTEQKQTSLESFVSYQTHKDLSGYLNKSNIAADYMRSHNDKFPIDYYQVEVSDSANQQKYLVYVHMKSADILGWTTSPHIQKDHTSYEINLAKSYIQTLGYSPAEFIVVRPTSSNAPIIFENRNNQIGESYLQLYVSIQNDQAASFQAKFSVPESYIDWQKKQDRSTFTMSIVSIITSLLMTFGAVFIAIKYRKHITFSRGLFLTLVFFVTAAFHNINTFPAQKVMFAGDPNGEMIILFNIILSTVFTFVMAAAVYLCLVSGDGMWRRDGQNLWPRWRDSYYGEYVLRSMGIGYLFCLIILGFQRIMFFIGEEFFDVWSVNDPFHSNYNIMLPMLFPLLAWAAAISEEAIYRLFGIILFKKLVKNTFVAILIPSMIWALGHTQYPIYPAYTRFIEVTILGLIFGYIFLKHGFITAVFAHVSVNSILMGLSLFGIPGGAAHGLIGLFYMASPALTAYIIFLLHSRFRKAGPPSVHPPASDASLVPAAHPEEPR